MHTCSIYNFLLLAWTCMVYSFVIQFEFLIIENCHKIDRAMTFSLNIYSTANECGR